jgi:CheY-like chemotaxis protein
MPRHPHANRHRAQSASPQEEVAALRDDLSSLFPIVAAVCGPDHPVAHLLARTLTRRESSMADTRQRLRLALFALAELPEAVQQRLRAWPHQTTDTPRAAPAPDLRLPRPKGTILVVVGDRPGAGAAAAILAAVGCAVRPVLDGCEARQEVRRLRPALVILDILLRGDDNNDGLTLMLDLLDEGIPVLALCTEPVVPLEPQIAFLPRTFPPDDLLATVGHFLTIRDPAGEDPA